MAGIIRSLYLYQTRGNGLADIAFNYLVDAQGRVYEGRYGGVDKNIVGSHTAGFNTGTIGIALIGNFSKSGPASKQVQALDTLLAWRLDVGHIDPKSRVTLTSEGNERFAKGKTVSFPPSSPIATPAAPTARRRGLLEDGADPRVGGDGGRPEGARPDADPAGDRGALQADPGSGRG